jgi:hypothetical protein
MIQYSRSCTLSREARAILSPGSSPHVDFLKEGFPALLITVTLGLLWLLLRFLVLAGQADNPIGSVGDWEPHGKLSGPGRGKIAQIECLRYTSLVCRSITVWLPML